MLSRELLFYPSPINFNYLSGIGSLLGLILVNQLITGVLLACFYIPTLDLAFNAVDYVTRDVNYGFTVRNLHSIGASFFITLIYIHIGRAIYYGSYQKPRTII